MKKFFPFILLLFASACGTSSQNGAQHAEALAQPIVVEHPELKSIFEQYQMPGSFLLYDPQNNQYITYDSARCRVQFSPASTFKIPNSLIGLETGVIADENFVIKWDGKKRSVAAWNQDHTLASAMKVSAVPYYQELARRVGRARMEEWVQKLQFGNMQVDTLDAFWLMGASKISQYQQVDFLQRLNENKLPVSQRSTDIVKRITTLRDSAGYVLHGKTGWSANDTTNVGWFVGWVEHNGKAYYFATNVQTAEPAPETFFLGRRAITEAIHFA